MNVAIPQWLAIALIGAGLVGAALTLIIAIRAFLRARRGEYYVIREEARRTAIRLSLLFLLFAVFSIGVLLIPRQTARHQPVPSATPTPSQIPTFTRPAPTGTATTTPTPQATATEPYIPTSTPQATLPISLTTPIPSAISPPGDASFEFWTLAEDVDDASQPVNPTAQFPSGTARVYLFFHYDGLLPDIPWSVVWYLEGEYLRGRTSLWEPERSTGTRFEFLDLGEYPPGEYEVQVWLENTLQMRVHFAVAEADQ